MIGYGKRMGMTLHGRAACARAGVDKSKHSDAEERAARTTKSVPMPDPILNTVQRLNTLPLLLMGF